VLVSIKYIILWILEVLQNCKSVTSLVFSESQVKCISAYLAIILVADCSSPYGKRIFQGGCWSSWKAIYRLRIR